jgi:hypothetical protein
LERRANETAVYDWQGTQIALICFDELTHFTALGGNWKIRPAAGL